MTEELAKLLRKLYGLINYENVRQAGEVASMTPTPLGDVASGMLAVDDLRKGDYLGAAGNAVGLLPFVPGMAGSLMPIRKYLKEMQDATDVVDGMVVRADIPNMSSIGSSLENYKVLPGVKEMKLWDTSKPKYYSVSEEARTKKLANQIKESNELNPLIVAIDKKGPYIIEGGHRFDALRELGKKSFPAKVVIDMD